MTLFRKIFSFPTLTLIVALTLSVIAAWYSVLGLTAIFAAAVIPVIIMGGSLEVAKVVTTLWLHKYWNRATWKLKIYLIPAVISLAFLTSMGIFGFLSKAHSDQTLVSGDTSAKVELVDEKIKIARENIAMNRKALEQMNSQVDQLLGRTDDDRGANRAIQVRRQQATERNLLTKEIEAEQAEIAQLNEEVAPIRAEIRKIEAEVGPIKYIAALIYGDNPDTNLLERAVRWVIILIVFVFDPLALMLMLAAQTSYRWLEEDLNKEKEKKIEGKVKPEIISANVGEVEDYVPDARILQHDVGKNIVRVDEGLGEPLPKEPLPDADEDDNELEPNEAGTARQVESTEQVAIETEGVTVHEIQEGYYDVEGKSMSKAALLVMRPELFSAKPDNEQSSTNFGPSFPKFAKKSDIFVRVDVLPNKVFKFDGYKWIEINKESSDSYLYDEKYIHHLVSKIESGEYDVELLSENEKAQIEEYLQSASK
jgi:hypothetical protein